MASRIINYHGNEKIYNKEAVNELLETKQDTLVIDTSLDSTSEHPVQNKAIANAIQLEADTRHHADDVLEGKMGDLNDLTTVAKTDLVTAINEVNEKVTNLEDTLLPMDEVPTEDSEKPVKSGGIYDAIQFASVKVGETMFWHLQDDSSPENREVHSDNPFVFNFKGQEMSVETHDGNVQLCMLKDIPDGWHALDGTAELLATDYPDLAAFMPENVTTDGKIWLPYVQHKIIKVKY